MIQRAADRKQLSVRTLAPLAGISEGRWRQIVNGYQSVGRGEFVAVTAPALTLARMARAVGLDAPALRAAGRTDAADELERLRDEPPHRDDAPARANIGRMELAIRRIEDVLDHPDLEDSWRVNMIRGILFTYRRSVARADGRDVAQPDDGDAEQSAAG